MEVHFTPEQEAQIEQIASKAGTDPEHLVKDAVLHLLEETVAGLNIIPAVCLLKCVGCGRRQT